MTPISKFVLATALLLALSPASAMAKGSDHSHDGGVSQSERGDAGRDSRKEDKADTGRDSRDDKSNTGKDGPNHDKGDTSEDGGSQDNRDK